MRTTRPWPRRMARDRPTWTDRTGPDRIGEGGDRGGKGRRGGKEGGEERREGRKEMSQRSSSAPQHHARGRTDGVHGSRTR